MTAGLAVTVNCVHGGVLVVGEDKFDEFCAVVELDAGGCSPVDEESVDDVLVDCESPDSVVVVDAVHLRS